MNTLTLYEDMKKKHPYTEITMYKAGIKGDSRVNNALIGMARNTSGISPQRNTKSIYSLTGWSVHSQI